MVAALREATFPWGPARSPSQAAVLMRDKSVVQARSPSTVQAGLFLVVLTPTPVGPILLRARWSRSRTPTAVELEPEMSPSTTAPRSALATYSGPQRHLRSEIG